MTTRLVCPDALSADLGPAVEPAAGMVIRHDQATGEYLDARIGRGDRAVKVVEDARAECAAAGAR